MALFMNGLMKYPAIFVPDWTVMAVVQRPAVSNSAAEDNCAFCIPDCPQQGCCANPVLIEARTPKLRATDKYRFGIHHEQ